MGILGTDHTLRSGHLLFLLLMVSSVLLGFSYLNEMYQRIQIQEKMERQAQHISAERSIIQHKDSLLQAQIENRNKEIKRLQDMHGFQIQQQNSMCEQERNNLQQTIFSKDATITEVKTEYERVKQRFEDLRSVMEQFEKNQSRLLEKFSTQSTQCMNVINMLSELCSKGRDNLMQKLAQATKQKEVLSTSVKTTASTLLLSTPQDTIHNTKHPSLSPPTKNTTLNSDDRKQSGLNGMQKLQELISVLNHTNITKEYEYEIVKLQKIQDLTEENNAFKPQTGKDGNDDNEITDKDLLTDLLMDRIKTQVIEITTRTKLTDLNEENNVFKPQTRKDGNNYDNNNEITDNEYLPKNLLMEKVKTQVIEESRTNFTDLNKKNNVFKPQTGKNGNDYNDNNEITDDEYLPTDLLMERVKTQVIKTTRTNLTDLNKALNSNNQSQSKIKNINNSQYSVLSENKNLQLTNQQSRQADILTKEELSSKLKENITLAKNEVKTNSTGKILEVPNKLQKPTEKPAKTQYGDANKVKEPYDYENNSDKVEKSEDKLYRTGQILEAPKKFQNLSVKQAKTQDGDANKAKESYDYENNAEDIEKREDKVNSKGKILEVSKKLQRLTVEKAKIQDVDINKEKEPYDYENNARKDVEKGLELNDQELSEILA